MKLNKNKKVPEWHARRSGEGASHGPKHAANRTHCTVRLGQYPVTIGKRLKTSLRQRNTHSKQRYTTTLQSKRERNNEHERPHLVEVVAALSLTPHHVFIRRILPELLPTHAAQVPVVQRLTRVRDLEWQLLLGVEGAVGGGFHRVNNFNLVTRV
jgi:hypothetical protein